MEQTMKKYDNLDGLRTFSAIGIILMHVLSNGNYPRTEMMGGEMSVFTTFIFSLIGRMGTLVQLFFMMSAFGMCCGYYEKIKNNTISLEDFYKKRYIKILPFFSMLVFIDLIISGFEKTNIIEGFADVTLLFGFLPNSNISVIGVGWTLGVIFAFYILFPFFVFMLWNKKRAWISLSVSLILYYSCAYYFVVNDTPVACNLLQWLYYFVFGGIIFLYKDTIQRIVLQRKKLFTVGLLLLFCVWYINTNEILSVIFTSFLFSYMLCYAISVKSSLLANKFTKFMSSISMEIYLAHMFIFRVLEKIKLLHVFTNEILSYILASVLVLVGVTAFAYIVQKGISKVMSRRIKK